MGAVLLAAWLIDEQKREESKENVVQQEVNSESSKTIMGR